MVVMSEGMPVFTITCNYCGTQYEMFMYQASIDRAYPIVYNANPLSRGCVSSSAVVDTSVEFRGTHYCEKLKNRPPTILEIDGVKFP